MGDNKREVDEFRPVRSDDFQSVREEAADEARYWLNEARAAARIGDLRRAYEDTYRGLDVLFLSAQWAIVAKQLDEMCSENYPAAFGIGALRFSFDAAKYIPGWNAILRKLTATARNQGLDTRKAMKGLAEL